MFKAFNPVLDRLRSCAEVSTIFKTDYLSKPYNALNALLEIKSNGQARPICNLVYARNIQMLIACLDSISPRFLSNSNHRIYRKRVCTSLFLWTVLE